MSLPRLSFEQLREVVQKLPLEEREILMADLLGMTPEEPEVLNALHEAMDRMEAGQTISDADLDAYMEQKRKERSHGSIGVSRL